MEVDIKKGVLSELSPLCCAVEHPDTLGHVSTVSVARRPYHGGPLYLPDLFIRAHDRQVAPRRTHRVRA